MPKKQRQFLFRIEGAFPHDAEKLRERMHKETYEELFTLGVMQYTKWHPLPINAKNTEKRVTGCDALEGTDRMFRQQNSGQMPKVLG